VIQDQLLRRGFFPKELPPVFTSENFADFIKLHDDLNIGSELADKTVMSRPAIHNLARPGQMRRKLQIPNPLNFLQLATILDQNWQTVEGHLQKSRLSASKPVDASYVRAFVPECSGGELPKLRAKARATGRYLVKTDISRFYHSIYTHSIPWALHGKDWSKKNRREGLGNELDRVLRNGQDGQTLGIPVGPDTSLVIAEIIGAAIDDRIQDAMPHGFRFMDDFEAAFGSRAAAENGLLRIEEALAEFELGINRLKTTITQLPQVLERPWVNSIRAYHIDEEGAITEDELLRYFSHVFEAASSFSFDPVVAYGVNRLRAIHVDQEVWPMFQDLLFQCALADPSSLPIVLGQQYRHNEYGVSERLDDALNEIIVVHSSLGHASEVTWALWGAIWFQRRLSTEAAFAASGLDDPAAGLMTLLAYDKGVFPGLPNPEAWASCQ